LESRPDVAVACGRLRERFPSASVYNMLCDMEWDTPVGETKACGGIALVRAEAFETCGGFREALIAGEEPELCVRLRAAGWKIHRLDEEMGIHDAGMHRFSQWWRRSVRSGYAFAEGAALHGRPPERHWVRESRRAWLWGAIVPAGVLATSVAAWPWGLFAWAVFPLQAARIALRTQGSLLQRMLRAGFLLLGKVPEAIGQMRYLIWRRIGKHQALIEYK
jgi:GT2 family glycosyltransferase